jgi:hypothetical protein
MVKPLTWISYSTVSAYRRHGRLPSRQPKCGSTTRLRGVCPAESRALGRAGSASSWPSTSGPNDTDPLTARAYGSSSSFAGLHRRPRPGSHGPLTRYP